MIFNQYKSSPNCFCILKITTGRGSRCGCRLDISLSASLLWLSNSICLDTRLHRARSMDPLRVYARCGSLWHCCFFLTRASDWWQTSDSVVTCKIWAFCLYFSIQKKRKQTQQGGPDSGGTFAPCVCGAYPLFLGLFLSRNRTKLAASTFFVCRIYVDFPPWTMGDSVFLDRQNSYLVSVAFIWLKCNGLVLIW